MIGKNTVTDFSTLEKNWHEATDILDIGREIFQSLPKNQAPLWASSILRFCYSKYQRSVPEIDLVLGIADTPSEWHKAHDAFSQVRDLMLKEERKIIWKKHKLLSLLCLSECVAKVTFNSTETDVPFDSDSGWWVVSCARDYASLFKDDGFLMSLWEHVSKPLQMAKVPERI